LHFHHLGEALTQLRKENVREERLFALFFNEIVSFIKKSGCHHRTCFSFMDRNVFEMTEKN